MKTLEIPEPQTQIITLGYYEIQQQNKSTGMWYTVADIGDKFERTITWRRRHFLFWAWLSKKVTDKRLTTKSITGIREEAREYALSLTGRVRIFEPSRITDVDGAGNVWCSQERIIWRDGKWLI